MYRIHRIQLRADDSATSPKRLIIPVIGSVVKCFSDGVVGWLFGPLRIHHRMIKHLPNLEGVELRRSWGLGGPSGPSGAREPFWKMLARSWSVLAHVGDMLCTSGGAIKRSRVSRVPR